MKKIKIMMINNSNHNIYIDLDGKAETDDIIVLGAKAKINMKLDEKRVSELQNQFGADLMIRKVK